MTKKDIIPTSTKNYATQNGNRKYKMKKAQNDRNKSVNSHQGATNFTHRANNKSSNNNKKAHKGSHAENKRRNGPQIAPSANSKSEEPHKNGMEAAANVSEKSDKMKDVNSQCPSGRAGDSTCLYDDLNELSTSHSSSSNGPTDHLLSTLKSTEIPSEQKAAMVSHEEAIDRLKPFRRNNKVLDPSSQNCLHTDEEDLYTGFDEVDNCVARNRPQVIDRTSPESYCINNDLCIGRLPCGKHIVEVDSTPKDHSQTLTPAAVDPSRDGETEEASSTASTGGGIRNSGTSGKTRENETHGASALSSWRQWSQSKKEELIANVREKIEELQDARTCKVCLVQPANRLFRPCGHLSCCDACAGRMKECPICRIPIQGVVVVVYPRLRKRAISNFVDFDLVLQKNGCFGVSLDD